MANVICAACGRGNRDIAKYCRFCGKMVQASAPVAATPAAAATQSAAPPSAAASSVVIPVDYIGHGKIRAELDKIKKNIKFQKQRQSVGVGGTIGSKIFIFRGKTGAGKTLVAKHFIEELRREECLSSDKVTSKEARELSKTYGDEYKLAQFLSDIKPAALVVDNATETPAYIHELILAASKSTQECVCVIIGNSEGFDEFFGKNAEDRQRVTQDFNFQDLSLEDLSLILMKKLQERGLIFAPDLKEHFLLYIKERKNDPSCEYKNGWLIEKDVIPAIDKNQQARLESLGSASLTAEDFKTIKAEDLPLKNKPRTIDEILAELDDMTGMTDVKKTVREIANKIQIQKEQEKKDGTKSAGEGNNIVITGNPGTGKTTIVRTLGALFNAIGLLDSDTVVEVNGNDLKGSYLGQSKDKVNEKCDEAMGGILFVDEAYVLADTQRSSGAADEFAKEAVEILMTRLENDRTKFIGVVAGYEKQMDIFLDKINPGMRRRFKHYLHLNDYNADELFEIFVKMVEKSGYTLTPDANEAAKKAITDMFNNKGPNFGNAGEIRVFFEKTTSRLASRLSTLSKEERADKLKTIEACDFPSDEKEERGVDEILAELDAMIGMTDIKKTVREIANKIQIQKEQEEKDGAKSTGEGNNIVITGNPGTGKTTIVRTLGALFKAIGLLRTDNVIEINGNDLKGTYLGESKDKVNQRCDEARGGILFVDEAYVLADTERGSGPADSFAKEAVEILMTRLENDRTKFVGVVAGYEKEMQVFLDKINPGMRRRFKHYLSLSDYSAEELFAIFTSMVKKSGYTLTPEAGEAAKASITDMFNNKGPNFGNAGEIRVFFEKTTSRLASRLSTLSKEERADKLKIIEACDFPFEKKEERTVSEILAELDAMIGMTDIKKTVREIANKIQIQKEQEEKDGKKSAGEGNNIVITGNPGTGKTTIVRTLGALFQAIGLLKTDTVIEVNGNDLKGSYLGQSKDRVNEKCDAARGGILFVDEAYVLADTQRGGPKDQYASEAVEILMTRLENDRTKFVGVVAGYEKEMQVFLDTVNPGMRRRFKHYLHLSDYSAEELFAIFNSMAGKAGFTLTPEASEAAKAAITDMYNNKGPNFGNAGEIRVFFERITSRQATRLTELSKEERSEKLKTIEASDISANEGGAA